MRRICFYHAGCPDGFGAAWAVWRAWGDRCKYVPRNHGSPLDASRLERALVVFVDIAPPPELMSELCEKAGELIVLDHHLSSRNAYERDPFLVQAVHDHGHEVLFDLEHSGAVLAWQRFGAPQPVPELLRYVEDQDLWNWKLPGSEQVNAALASYPQRFDLWSELAERPIEELAREGEPLIRARGVELERLLSNAHAIQIDGRKIEAVNATQHRSILGHQLAQRAAYGSACGCVYRVSGNRVDASLYSIGDLDISELAVQLGGGGHRNAAGFSVPLAVWLRDFIEGR